MQAESKGDEPKPATPIASERVDTTAPEQQSTDRHTA